MALLVNSTRHLKKINANLSQTLPKKNPKTKTQTNKQTTTTKTTEEEGTLMN